MQQSIDTHRETALDSPYSRDRAEAIEQLRAIYPDADERGKRVIAETFREIAVESSHRDERESARKQLLACFEGDPAAIEGIVLETLTELAENGKFSDDRLAAIDALREVYPDLGEPHRETVGSALAAIAGNATYEDERRRARRRLSDVSRVERELGDDADDDSGAEESVGYLGQSLAEHLENAAHESATECRQRAEEVQEFMDDQPLDDESYEDIYEDVTGLIEAFEALGTDGKLAEDRIERVERIASRVERLYERK